MDFKTDLNNLINLIKDGSNQDEIKREYLKLVKRYHPDGVEENLKSTYNEYMVVLNSVYTKGKTEYEKGFRSIHENQINKLDRKAVDQNTLEIMGHYLNAIKCYEFILKNCSDRVLVDSVEFDYYMLKDYNAKLARTLLNNNENMLMK